jgi:hypothetical protein
LDGRIVAKNRRPRYEQPKKYPALSDAGLTREQVSRLSVARSYRSYKDPARILPGALYSVDGNVCTLTGQQHYGEYLLFKYNIVDENGKTIAVKAKNCDLLALNSGLVFVS